MAERSEQSGEGGAWMSQEEAAGWRAHRGKAPEAPTAAKKKLTPAAVAAMLLDASASGDAARARQALALGAGPNIRARAKPYPTPVDLALRGGHEDLALELVEAGGWVGPHPWPKEPFERFNQAVAAGSFPPAMERELALVLVQRLIQHGKTWRALAKARDLRAKPISDDDLAKACLVARRHDLAREGVAAGAGLGEAAWAEAAPSFQYVADLKSERRREDFLSLLSNPSANRGMVAPMAKRLFKIAIDSDDDELLLALLDAGMRPGRSWSVAREGHGGREGGGSHAWTALAAAASRPGSGGFDILKACPPAVEAAAQGDSPWALAAVAVGRLMEMRALGAKIDGVDDKGRSLAHVWALVDSEPRAGWATLAAKEPALFAARDALGKTGYELMAEKLGGAERDQFMASLSRIEGREIRAEAPLPARAAPAPRRRL